MDFIKNLMPLNIQMFAESGEDDANNNTNSSKDEDVSTNDSKENKSEEKKYSDKELNDISLKNEKKALAKQLKDLGIDNVDEAKEILAKAKAEKEANKSQDEKTNEIVKERDKALLEAMNSKIENALLRKGVSENKVERAVRLIDKANIVDESGKIDFSKLSTEVDATLKDFPELIPKDEEDKKGFKIGGDGKEDKKDQSEQLSNIFGNKK